MSVKKKSAENYTGFEQGPIRPPSEAYSLLIRVTRNCPWNRCTFCPVYKGSRFSLRPVDHVKKDIDLVHHNVMMLRQMTDTAGQIDREKLNAAARNFNPTELKALNAVLNWTAGGMKSVFIQDANSLIIRPGDLIDILTHLKNRFPWANRITSYARSHTIVRIKASDLKAIGEAGLNRIHIGLESGSDEVLKMVKKGTTKAAHIKAGLKVKEAGMELSEYVMPGLGGRKLSRVHALETADALNQIDPHFIRLRSLAIPNSVELFQDWQKGEFEKCTDLEMAEEILLFLENLDNITSTLKSDHILNLFQDVEGRFPDDQGKMIQVVREFLSIAPERQMVYQVGRRLGMFSGIEDLEKPELTEKVEQACEKLGVTPENVDVTIDELMKRFI